MACAWALPISGSPWTVGVPDGFHGCRVSPPGAVWEFQCSSSKPRLNVQSCIRLCIAKRFAVAASMSFPLPRTKFAGSHFDVNQTFVHG